MNAPEPALILVEAVPPFGLRLKFANGVEGVVDLDGELKSSLTGPMFEPLRDPDYFQRVTLEDGAPTWPNGLDLAPDALYHDLAAKATPAQKAG